MIGNHLSDHGSFAAQRVLAHALDNFIRCLSGNDRNQLTLISHIKRIESQYFAGALDGFTDWNIALLQQHSDLRLAGNFIQGGSYAAAGWIAQAVDSRHSVAAHHFEHYVNQAMEWRAVAFNRPFKLQVLPLRHDRHAVIANESAENDLVARTRAIRGDLYWPVDHAQPRRRDEHLVALAAIDNLGVRSEERRVAK